jgi:DNA recombination protein RmuC
MEIISLLTGFLVGTTFAYIIFYLFNKTKSVSKKEFEELSSKLNENITFSRLNEAKAKDISAINEGLTEKLSSKENTISQNMQKIAELTATNAFLSEKLDTQKANFEELKKTAHLEFTKIANELLEEKSSKFTEANKTNIETLLNPLKEDINKFKTKVEETHTEDTKQRTSLDERIKGLIEQTTKISSEANNLATALKGKPQKRGNWGEMILERILEDSGLTKDREYFIQQSMKDEDGNNLRPDVIVKLPDERDIVIDSKVSLIAYDKFVASENLDEQKIFLAEHLKSTYDHINQLSSKKYDNLETSFGSTMMFVPIEPAFLLALQHDSNLWAYAYSKRILLVSPTNLIACLKLISDLWKREWQNKNAMAIVKRGELLYDKFIGFAENFVEIGKKIKLAHDAYNDALGQLNTGRGNVIWQANELRELGLKSDKKIPDKLFPIDIEKTEVENEK